MYQGPYCGVLLAQAGADVVKVESPDGDPLRRRDARTGAPPSFAMMNIGKRGIVIDLKSASGRQVLVDLVGVSDVVFENFSPGVMESLGVGPAVLCAANPGLVYASGTGFGRSGPARDHRAMDITVQAWSGVMSVTGFPDGPPVKSGAAFVDFLSGTHLYAGIVTALVERERTGRGRVVEVSMAETAYWTLMSSLAGFVREGVAPRMGNKQAANGMSPYDVYPTADGFVAVLCVTERHWQNLCSAMGRPELATDPRFDRNGRRVEAMAAVDALVSRWTSPLSRAEVFASGQQFGFPVAPVRDVAEVVADDHLRQRGFLVDVEHPDHGSIPLAGSPIVYEGSDRLPAALEPGHGADTGAVLAELLGYDATTVADLASRGAFG